MYLCGVTSKAGFCDLSAFGGNADPLDMGYLFGAALLDGDFLPGLEGGVNGGGGGGHIEGNACSL